MHADCQRALTSYLSRLTSKNAQYVVQVLKAQRVTPTSRDTANYMANLSNPTNAVEYKVTRFHPNPKIDENWAKLGIKIGNSIDYRRLGYRITPVSNEYMW